MRKLAPLPLLASVIACPLSANGIEGHPLVSAEPGETRADASDRVLDEAEVFSDDFESSLSAKLQDLESRTKLHIVVLSASTLSGGCGESGCPPLDCCLERSFSSFTRS